LTLRANQGFFNSFGKGQRVLAWGALGLAALCVSTGSTDPAHAAGRHAQRTLSWRKATQFGRPRFRPRLTVNVRTAAQFWRAWNGLRPGEKINVHGVTFSGEAVFRKQLRGWAEVHFDSRTRFTGTPGANRPAAWIDRSRGIRFYGGNLSNPKGGTGVMISDSSWVTWWNFVIHDTASTGLSVRGIHQPDTRLDLKGAIFHWGLNLALDPHTEKGTGLHGANLADSPFGISHSRFALYLHDGASGAGVEAGGRRSSDYFADNSLYLQCRNLTKVAIRFTAGNCVQLWGVNVTHNTFRYIDAENLTGRPFETSGMYAGQSLATDRVVYGRASHTNLNPRVGAVHWDRRYGAIFGNVTPSD
jgi:hypothetical protein